MDRLCKPNRRLTASSLAAPLALLSLVVATTATAQTVENGRAQQQATELSKQIEAAIGNSPMVETPTFDPCAIVPEAQVAKTFSDAQPAPERNRRIEKYGITECVWKNAKGQILLGVHETIAKPSDRAADEAESVATGIVDPLKRDALRSVRIERFAALSLDHAAFVEAADPARGILESGAFMALVKGRRGIQLFSPELAGRERNGALKALADLGTAAAEAMGK